MSKLYTESEVRKLLNEILMLSSSIDDAINSLTPIELPTDEDAEKSYYEQLEHRREVAKNFKGQVAGRHPDMFIGNEMQNMVRGYLECLQGIRDKIKGGGE